jgi:hypothetical protein
MLQTRLKLAPSYTYNSEAHKFTAEITKKALEEASLLDDAESDSKVMYIENVVAGYVFKHIQNRGDAWCLYYGADNSEWKHLEAWNHSITGWVVPFPSLLYGLGYLEQSKHAAGNLPTYRDYLRYELVFSESEVCEAYLNNYLGVQHVQTEDYAKKVIGFWAGSGITQCYLNSVKLYITLYAASAKDGAYKPQNLANICILLPQDEDQASQFMNEISVEVARLEQREVKVKFVDNLKDYVKSISFHMSLSGASGFVCDPLALFLSNVTRPGYRVIATPRSDLIGRKFIATVLGLMLEDWTWSGVSIHPGLMDKFTQHNALILNGINYNESEE